MIHIHQRVQIYLKNKTHSYKYNRLKNYLLSGELLFIFTGYSFSDEHINEIIFNCLRQNNRLFGIVLFYQDSEVENLHKLTSSYMNLNVFGPTKAIVNGTLGEWEFKKDELKDTEKFDSYWDEKGKKFTRGASGLLAQIFQHETDHLNGILFIDHAKDVKEELPK
mgnify:CR=1 FL=1